MTNYSWLDSKAVEEAVVVTASRRLAREIRRQHNQAKQDSGQLAWPTPQIFFINDWIRRLLDESDGDHLRYRLDSHSSSVLWARSIRRVLEDDLPGFSGLVRQFKQTWSRLHAWRVPLVEIERSAFTRDQRLFAIAAKHYRNALNKNRWTDDATQIDVAVDELEQRRIALPKRLIVVGFDRMTPAIRRLLTAVENVGTGVQTIAQTDMTERLHLFQYENRDAELRAAGHWARQLLKDQPNLRLAIVCPDIENDAAGVARSVREGFAPGWQSGHAMHLDAVELSYGRALSEYPAVAIALLLLRWVSDGLSSSDVSLLLRSRNIGGGHISGRCRLEEALRRLPDQRWRPAALLGALHVTDPGDDADRWRRYMQAVIGVGADTRGLKRPAHWAELIVSLLTSAGWPGVDSQATDEFQVINRWRELLNEFSATECVESRLDFNEARARISRMAAETLFQPESEHGLLPVIGALEAAGIEYDQLWVTGFDASRWPSAGNPLYNVSRRLQQEYGMPDSSTQDTLDFSRRVLHRLARSATTVIFSWAATEDGVEQQPSPLCMDLRFATELPFADPGRQAGTLIGNAEFQRPGSDVIPPAPDGSSIAGGAYTVQRQSRNPFAAFAFGRLYCNELSVFEPGISPRIRGTLTHQSLRNFYEGRPTRSDLLAMSAIDVEGRAADAVSRAIEPLRWNADELLRAIIELERTRLHGLIKMLVELERKREDFSVAMVEKDLHLTQSGITLNFRVDRVDQLADGSYLVIDYKSGAQKPLLNRDGQIHDLQLVVYALALGEKVSGLALLNLDSRATSMRRSKDGDGWASQFAAWSDTARHVIEDLAAGVAAVNLAIPASDCRDLSLLSRSEELRRGD